MTPEQEKLLREVLAELSMIRHELQRYGRWVAEHEERHVQEAAERDAE